MIQYLIIALGVLPAFILVGYTYLREKYMREPLRYLAQGFLYGIVGAFLATMLEAIIVDLGYVYEDVITTGEAIWKAFAGVALPEELVKLFLLWKLLRHNEFFNERLDGLCYAVALAMGFAATENFLYLFTNLNTWYDVAPMRALTAVPATMCFGVAMGFFYSLYYFDTKNVHMMIRAGLIPVLMHFVYQTVLFAVPMVSTSVSLVVAVLFYILAVWMYVVCKEHLDKQSLRKRRDPRQVAYYYKK